jgi:hypothetical protein
MEPVHAMKAIRVRASKRHRPRLGKIWIASRFVEVVGIIMRFPIATVFRIALTLHFVSCLRRYDAGFI